MANELEPLSCSLSPLMYELPKYRVVVLAGSAPLPHFAAQLPLSSQQLFQFFATRSGLCHSESARMAGDGDCVDQVRLSLYIDTSDEVFQTPQRPGTSSECGQLLTYRHL